MTDNSALRLAVDIGGTFTDVVLVDGAGTPLATTKVATTPANPTDGALAGVRKVMADAGRPLADVAGFIHGTTLATNALIERRGACVASITNAGFRDILEIAYERRYSQYDIDLEKPDLIVPRERCFTIAGRMSARGEELEPLDEAAIDGLAGDIEAADAEAVAICLLHAYANPAHEIALRGRLQALLPDTAISISSDVSPEAREFERLCTTVANAYIQPMMASYLANFAQKFAKHGLACPILMMTAGGGMTSLETAARLPIRLVESGPAGGAILAAQVAETLGDRQVLSFDMGGTTAKLCLIDDFRPQKSRQFEISRAERFIKGSGMPVRIPVVDMIEIGAGGGSIAAVDRLGRLTVGPVSAGADPGPAAFGKGGEHPTVTDADVLLGYIDPDSFAEGRLEIDTGAARRAIECHVAGPLALDANGGAEGIGQIVDESMASAARMHAVESGKDLASRTMIAFGGNGPLHATRVARRAGVNRIVIPRNPGVGSAVGFLFAPVSFELVRSRYETLETLDIPGVSALFAEMAETAEAVIRAGAPGQDLVHRRSAFMRYHGQGHEIEIELPDRSLLAADVSQLQTAFEAGYRAQFSRAVPGMTIEILNWALSVSTVQEKPEPVQQLAASWLVEPSAMRRIQCDVSQDEVEAGVFIRHDLKPGDRVEGPALIIEAQTTTLVSADFWATVDNAGNLVLSRDTGETTP